MNRRDRRARRTKGHARTEGWYDRDEVQLDQMTRDNLVELGFSSCRIENRHRFGWRYWEMTEAGALQSPYVRGKSIDSPQVQSSCSQGHAPPGPDCHCGVYYVNNWAPFYDTVQAIDWIQRVNRGGVNLLDRVALTWGVALDEVRYDQTDHWGVRPRRTGRYRILGALLPTSEHIAMLKSTLGVPVLGRISPLFANAIEKDWDATAPRDFDQVRARYEKDRVCVTLPRTEADPLSIISIPRNVTPWR